jgi:hypothetical protein
MTLVLALPTSRFTVQLSDRRLTRATADSSGNLNYVLDTDDGNKAGALQCRDARVAYAFTGLAGTGLGFKTSDWLRVTLLKAAEPDFLIHPLVHRLAERATREFSANPRILALPKSHRRLSIIFTGHAMPVSRRPVTQGWTITNFQRRFDTGPPDGVDDAEAWDAFRVWSWHEAVPQSERFGWVLRLGQWQGVSKDQYSRLERLLGEDRPPHAILGCALKIMHAASDAAVTHQTVGKQISVIIIPSHPSESPWCGAESNVPTNDVFMPDMLVATSAKDCIWMHPRVTHVPTGKERFASVPRVHRKAPCPCESGETYGRCHRRFRYDIPRAHQADREKVTFAVGEGKVTVTRDRL